MSGSQLAEWERGMRDAAKIAQNQHDTFKSTEYATGQPLSSLKERFACKQIIIGILEAIAQSREKAKPMLTSINICRARTPEDLRNEVLRDLSRRLTTAQIGLNSRTQSDRTKAQAQVTLLEHIISFWQDVRLEAPTE